MNDDKLWQSIRYFFRQFRDHGVVQHQLNSFHDFIERELPLIIQSRNPLTITKKDDTETTVYNITVSNPRLVPPSFKSKNGTYIELYPYQARIQNMTYASPLLVDFMHTVTKYSNVDGDEEPKKLSEERYVSNDVIIGYIPIMVQSKYCRLFGKNNAKHNECKYDRGGYFIVKGQEKVIISQEKFAENRLFVGKKRNEKFSFYTEVKSIHPLTQYVYSTYIRYHTKNDEIRIKIPKAKEDINIMTIFKVLGCKSDKEILDMIKAQSTEEEGKIYEEMLLPTMMENINVRSQQDAVNTLCNIYNYIDPEVSKLRELLQKVLIPHIGDNIDDKIIYLVYSMKALLDTIRGKRKLDDRDNMANKRIDTPGMMMGHLFRYLYHKFMSDLSKDITNPNAQINMSKIVKSNSIEIGFRYALSTGHWHVKNENLIVKKVGVAQVLNRFNYYATLSHLRRINSELDNNAKLTTPRQVHGSSIMAVCVAETPEGQGIGITKNLAMLATLTTDVDPLPLTDLLTYLNIVPITTKSLFNIPHTYGKILVNGKWVGSIENIMELASELKKCRRNGKINNMTSIRVDYQYNELLILTTGGRFVHPVFVVHNNRCLIDDYEFQDETSWRHLIRDGIVEYLDADEMESCMIAMDPKELSDPYVKFTHCEIHASAMLGLCGSLIPFANHTQSPRVAYQASMCKQAVGVYTTNYQDRMDSGNHILWSPQRPMVDTQYTDIIHANKIPAGQNIIVAFGCYSG